MSDSDAVIGQLYLALRKAEQDRATLVQVLSWLKSGDLDLSRVVVDSNGVSISPDNPVE